MEYLIAFLLVVLTIDLLFRWFRRVRQAASAPLPDTGELYQIAETVYGRFSAAALPGELLEYPNFIQGVDHLDTAAYSNADLIQYFNGDNAAVACMALEALARRSNRQDVRGPLLDAISDVIPWTRFFALRALGNGIEADDPVVGALVARLDPRWDDPFSIRFLQEFVRERVAQGEKLAFGGHLARMEDEQARWLIEFLTRVDDDLTRELIAELKSWRDEKIDLDALKAIGRIWDPPKDSGLPIEHPALAAIVSRLQSDIQKTPAVSFLVVGESGVGKSSIVRVLGQRLQRQGWTIFEAGHAELLAGMVYMGQLEARLRELVQHLGGRRRVLWVVPDFRGLSWAGRHQADPTSVLDFLLPLIERGEVTVVGEIAPDAYHRLLQSKPRCRSALDACRVEPLGEKPTLELAGQWLQHMTPDGAPAIMTAEALAEARTLTQQFDGNRVSPGGLLHLLKLTLRRQFAGSHDAPVEIRLDDLIETLGQLTGLPSSILDEREQLDLAGLKNLFGKRVMAQSEAVECLVDRVAMIKAGVTDPTRPLGVFLFAGPTGTGKTEIAKTLAEFLFASVERLVRLDMSELQDESSLARILGDPSDRDESASLIQMIRKQPFSVLLLDEFEKAHPRIWDLFLQVFDDGRLSDRQGRTADFRHVLIIMTSNLGSDISTGLGLGFVEREGEFNPQLTERAVWKAFRKEFLNRIDRIVIFRPLSRDTMRQILRRELDAAFSRRGLRNRSWAAEWDESAIEFLLDKGFTDDLGARPLRRAIERYLLAPLALTIVNHQFPEGDQFLFVRASGDGLAVEFVDPDGSVDEQPAEAIAPDAPANEAAPANLQIEDVVFTPHGSPDELNLLRSSFDRIEASIESSEFRGAKTAALQLTGEAGFWESPERFEILDEAEYIDRIESGLSTARRLLGRLDSFHGRSSNSVRELIGRVAQQLYLLEHACDDVRLKRAREAFVLVEAGHDAGPASASNDEFARQLSQMYRRWAKKRGMRCELLREHSTTDGEPYSVLLSITGYASFALLDGESGLHVFEIPVGTRKPAKRRVARVLVAPQSGKQPARDTNELRREAARDLDIVRAVPLQVVRHYRETPSPLVRDSQRGWRTGKLGRVLDGDFDLMH